MPKNWASPSGASFGDLALAGKNPVRLGERCNRVFMESDLVHHQQRGAAKEDLVVRPVVFHRPELPQQGGGRPAHRNHIFYQGATAANRGIVAAFQHVCGKRSRCRPPRRHRGYRAAASIHARTGLGDLPIQGVRPGRPHYEITSFECNAAPTTARFAR